MITDSKDICTWVYIVGDDIWEPFAPLYKRPGPEPKSTDSKLMAHTLCIYAHRLNGESDFLQIKAQAFPN